MSKRARIPVTLPAPTALAQSPLETAWLPVGDIIESPLNPRRHPGPKDELEELVESIRTNGVMHPIVVRRSTFEPGRHEIVAGSRRHRAAALAGLEFVPATIRDVTDGQLLELALTENIQRRNMHPLDEAKALEKLRTIDPIYRDDEVLAGKIGRSETYVRDRLKLLKLDELVLEALEHDAITAKHAERIARLPKDQHQAALKACFEWLFTTVDSHEPGKLVDARDWQNCAAALGRLADLDKWVEEHGKVDLEDPTVRTQLKLEPELEQRTDEDDAADLAAATVPLLQVSEGYLFRKEAKALGMLTSGDWKEVKGKGKRCDDTRAAVVVHGGKTRTLDVCANKRCQTHFPKPKATGGVRSSVPSWKAEEEKRRKRDEEWKRVNARYFAALTPHVQAKFTKTTAEVVRRVLDGWELRAVEELFGVKLTDATAAVVLVLSSVRTNGLEWFGQDAKKLGLDVRKVTAAIAAEDKAAAKAAAKPARSGSAAKKASAKKGQAKK